MIKAETCVCCGRVIPEGSQYCVICGNKVKGKQTNYDRIRNMNAEELADFIADIYADNEHSEIRISGEWMAYEDIEKWLESEVEGE